MPAHPRSRFRRLGTLTLLGGLAGAPLLAQTITAYSSGSLPMPPIRHWAAPTMPATAVR